MIIWYTFCVLKYWFHLMHLTPLLCKLTCLPLCLKKNYLIIWYAYFVLNHFFHLTCLTPLLGGFTCLLLCLKKNLLDHLICFLCLETFLLFIYLDKLNIGFELLKILRALTDQFIKLKISHLSGRSEERRVGKECA